MKTTLLETPAQLWGHHQLICTSGLTGDAFWGTGLVLSQTGGAVPGLRVRLPEELDLRFPAGEAEEVCFTGNAFSLSVNGQMVCGAMPDDLHLLVEGPCETERPGEGLRVVSDGNRTLIGVATGFDPTWLHRADPVALLREGMAELEQLPVPEGLGPEGAAAYRKAVLLMRSQVYRPEGCIRHRWTTPERWPHRDMWLWDSVFHALGWRHLDPAMARDAVSAVFDCQQPDGFIPHRMTPDGEISDFTQPPLLAYAVECIHQASPAPEWVRDLYPRLRAYLEWDLKNRDTDGGGLMEWHIEEHLDCRSGESGADNSPRFDLAKPLDATDFNAFLSNDFACMARLAPVAGFAGEADGWREQAEAWNGRIRQRLWDADQGFFFDYDPEIGDFQRVWSSSGFLPLFCGAATPEQAAELVRHLENGGRFDTALPVASVAPSDPTYVKDMWRGPSWLNHSWMIAEGLERYGYDREAERIRDAWIETLITEHRRYGTFFEYYDCEGETAPTKLFRKGVQGDAFPHQTIHFYGWTGTLFVDLCHRFRS